MPGMRWRTCLLLALWAGLASVSSTGTPMPSAARVQHAPEPAQTLARPAVASASLQLSSDPTASQQQQQQQQQEHWSVRRLHEAGHCHDLARENLQLYAVANTLLLTIGDLTTMDYFGFNWIKNVQQVGVTWWMLAALDKPTSEYVTSKGVKQCFLSPFALAPNLESYTSKGVDFKWGGSHFRAANWRKVHIIERVVKMGFNVLYSDMDVAWLRNPLNYFSATPHQMSMVVSTDLLLTGNRMHDEGLEEPRLSANINTGVFYVRAGPGGSSLMEAWASIEAQRVESEQRALNGVWKGLWEDRMFEKFGIPLASTTVAKGMTIMNNNITVGQLSIALFGHSYTWFVSKPHQHLGVRPYEVHFIWSGNGKFSKRQRMREAMLYHDPPEYYSQPRLLSVQLRYLKMPEGFNDWANFRENDSFAKTEAMAQFHLKSMHFQLGQLYYAFALALATNRTLIMPKLRCYCVKNWFMTKACKLEEDPTVAFPFDCTLGDVLKPARLVDGLRVGAGRALHIREHSFLENPRTPSSVKANMRIVRASNTTAQLLAKGSNVLMVPARLKDTQLADMLQPYSDVQWLHVTRPMLTFGGFSDGALERDFSQAMASATTYWCCRSPADMKRLQLPDRVEYRLKPLEQMRLTADLTGKADMAV